MHLYAAYCFVSVICFWQQPSVSTRPRAGAGVGRTAPPAHSQRGRGPYRAAANGGRGAYEGSQYGAVNGAYGGNSHRSAAGRHGYSPAGPRGGVQVHAESFRGRGPYVPLAARCARNPYAVPPPADVGRGEPSGRSRGRSRGGRTRG